MASELVALNSNWLDITAGGITPAGDWQTYGNSGCVNQWSPNVTYWPYAYVYNGPAKPIRLTMAEVERLRTAAKRDAKLKAVLAKFTDQIEVVVDLG